jgi:hypothetical protein
LVVTALTPAVTALWRTAGRRIADAGLPDDLPNRAEMVTVAGAFAAAQARAYAEETELHRVLGWELLTSGAFPAYGRLDRADLQTVELVTARCWRLIAIEVGHVRRELEVAA